MIIFSNRWIGYSRSEIFAHHYALACYIHPFLYSHLLFCLSFRSEAMEPASVAVFALVLAVAVEFDRITLVIPTSAANRDPKNENGQACTPQACPPCL
jgi:hypothetical protein